MYRLDRSVLGVSSYHQPIEDSYLAKLDYENQEIIELEENSIQ